MRIKGDFDSASKFLDESIAANPRLLEPRIEQGLLLEARARATGTPAAWRASLKHWQNLAAKLRGARSRPPEYYEAWLHVADALAGLGGRDQAAKALKGVLTLSPSAGGPEMLARYRQKLADLGG